jgi:hypothetical protein
VDYELFELGDVVLQSAVTLRSAKLANKTFGKIGRQGQGFGCHLEN